MREFIIETAIPIAVGILIGQGLYSLSESIVVTIAIGCPISLIFGMFVYPPLARFLRGER